MKKARYVDPMIGTVGDEQSETSHGGGKCHPGACVPGGMVQLSPDTVTGGDNGTGYNYCHDSIEGFSFNRMSGIGWYGDLGNLQIMPVTGETDLRSGSNEEFPLKKGTEGWKSRFSHEKEFAGAGYYSVELERYNILVETTVTEHTGMLRVQYPKNSRKKLILNFSRRIGGRADFEKIDIINDRRIEGCIICTPKGGGFGHGNGGIEYNLYFALELSVPAENMRFFSNEEFVDSHIRSYSHEDVGIVASFGEEADETVVIRCGISYVDIEGARNNLDTECPNFDFDRLKDSAEAKWEEAFGRVDVEGSDETDLKIFYTCLYHTLLDPHIATDCDGRFAVKGDIFRETEYSHRTVFSGWDVYRSEFPLLSLIDPETVNDEICSLLKIAEINNSSFPRWEVMGINAGCMVGDPGLIVVADAYMKGIRNYDCEKAYEVGKASVLLSEELGGKPFHSIRPYCKEYLEKAYVPEKLSDTLEYLLADYTLYKMAKAMGKTEDAELFMSRAETYGDNYNKELGFMAPRMENGEFVFESDRYDDDGTVESNIYQQSWFVPYDVKGLAKLFGEERTIELLDEFFEKAKLGSLWNDDYNHSNEPCHNITHYYNILGLPEKTQYWTRRVQKEAYRTGAFGFCGNEDVGQLSAWYVLSSLGFAQVCPADEEFYINTPLFKKAEIKLSKKYHSCSVSDTFKIVCSRDPLEGEYIRKMRLNGKELDRYYLTYSEITAGGTLEIDN